MVDYLDNAQTVVETLVTGAGAVSNAQTVVEALVTGAGAISNAQTVVEVIVSNQQNDTVQPIVFIAT